MVSYNYMRKFQAEKLEAMEAGEITLLPSHETIALLDKAERSNGASEEFLNELRFQAFSKPISDETHKEIRSRVSPRKPPDPGKAEKAAVLGAARKLRKAMSSSHFVPDGLKERLEQPLVELEALD